MNRITLPRATVEQALEAMRCAVPTGKITLYEWDKAVSDLDAALAQQAEPVEPVAWSGYDLDGMVEAFSRVIEAHYQRANPFQNPVDMDAQMALRILRGFIPAMKAYTDPPQRKPLMEGMLMGVYIDFDRAADPAWSKAEYLLHFARAVERAHGIGGSNG